MRLHFINIRVLCSGWAERTPFVCVTVLYTGVAPHCLDPGSVHSVTVETFCGEKWEESMQAHKTIRDMSKPKEDMQQKE